MDALSFDRLARHASSRLPRRTLAGLLGLGIAGLHDHTAGKKKKKKKVKRNRFNCVNSGNFCKNSGQCCSGICTGKKKKKKCRPHDQSTCQPGEDLCKGVTVACTTTHGFLGECVTTTGKAPYCYSAANCTPCRKDRDCEPTFGTGAACIVCAECTFDNPEGTACAGLAAAL